MKKYFLFMAILLGAIFIFPQIKLAAQTPVPADNAEVFEAKVSKILEEKTISRENGSQAVQQNLELQVLNGSRQNETISYQGIQEYDLPGSNRYEIGDKVQVQMTSDNEGREMFFIMDYVRRAPIYFLALIFALVIIVIGKSKGLKALLSLIISFIIILKFILPRLLAGDNPILIAIIGASAILAIIIYFTEGWQKKSHLAMVSVFCSLGVTLFFSGIFIYWAKLSGMAQEETSFLLGTTNTEIQFSGLLLAGIIIGAVGVLDDIIIGQLESVRQIKLLNPKLPAKRVFMAAYEIGNTHLSAIVNTLFLTYAGASLPLLLLFVSGQDAFSSLGQIINHEPLATEIIRTLAGSVGVALSMPISTALGAWFMPVEQKPTKKTT
jgi:uncharacterized membrane protein